MDSLLQEIRSCTICEENLPHGVRPVLQATPSARILIIGQAPGRKVHASGIPFNDASGKKLRTWMGITAETFYDPTQIAIVPMGFCYPGSAKSGDLPPRPECAAAWHSQVMAALTNIELTILLGKYAQNQYLPNTKGQPLTQLVANWESTLPILPLVHPSPRNIAWHKKNPWFEKQVVPALQELVSKLLKKN